MPVYAEGDPETSYPFLRLASRTVADELGLVAAHSVLFANQKRVVAARG